MVDSIRKNLTEGILPFWREMKDEKNGGFYGERDCDLTIHKEADKGTILQCRILWAFSSAYLALKDPGDFSCANWAFSYLKEHCVDEEYGGLYWSTHFDGTPAETTKHAYCMAFGIYGLSAYYEASGDGEALALAKSLTHTIEEKCTDSYGYLEEFDRQFQAVDNDKLSDTFCVEGKRAEKTMNTLLHVLEAYTELYRVSHEEEVGNRLQRIYRIFFDKVWNKEKGRLEVFFDKNYGSLMDMQSFGHDIEASWLLDRGADVLGEEQLKKEVHEMTDMLAETVYERAFRGNRLLNEVRMDEVDGTPIWWVQAEAVIGFTNAYEKHPQERKYKEAAEKIWNFIKTRFVDEHSGEWFNELHPDGTPKREMGLASAWKCPYHDSRMCLEIMRRVK